MDRLSAAVVLLALLACAHGAVPESRIDVNTPAAQNSLGFAADVPANSTSDETSRVMEHSASRSVIECLSRIVSRAEEEATKLGTQLFTQSDQQRDGDNAKQALYATIATVAACAAVMFGLLAACLILTVMGIRRLKANHQRRSHLRKWEQFDTAVSQLL